MYYSLTVRVPCSKSPHLRRVLAQVISKDPDSSSTTSDQHELTWYFDTAARATKILQIFRDLHELDVRLEETQGPAIT